MKTKQPFEGFYRLHPSTIGRLDTLSMDLRAQMVFIKMCLNADFTTGCYIGCADSVADKLSHNEITVKVARSILVELEERGLIRRLRNEATRGNYRIALDGYEVTMGANKGFRVCIEKSGSGLWGDIAYIGATGKTEEEEGEEPSELTPVAAASPTTPIPVSDPPAAESVSRHPMTLHAEEIFTKLGKRTGEKYLKLLDEYLAKNPDIVDDFENIIAFATTHYKKDYSWGEKIDSIESLVWRLKSPDDNCLLVQFNELKPNKKSGYMKKLRDRLGIEDTTPIEAVGRRKPGFGFDNILDL
jgi:hypothetical protein